VRGRGLAARPGRGGGGGGRGDPRRGGGRPLALARGRPARAARAGGANARGRGRAPGRLAGGVALIPWVVELLRAVDAGFGARPWFAALATADRAGRPGNRFVVTRRIEPDGPVWIVTDGRSEKVEHLAHQPAAELAFWLPILRVQFRVMGV